MTDKFTPEFIAQQRELAALAKYTLPLEAHNVDDEFFMNAYYITEKDGPEADIDENDQNFPHDKIIAITMLQTPRFADFPRADINTECLIAAASNYPDALTAIEERDKVIERMRSLLGFRDDALASYSEFYEKCQSLCGLPDANPSTEMDGIILTRLAEHDEIERLRASLERIADMSNVAPDWRRFPGVQAIHAHAVATLNGEERP